MAFDTFCKLTDVVGEAKDASHKGEIDVLSWSWGATQPGSFHRGGGGGAGKVAVQDIDSLSLTFSKITVEYREQDAMGGTAGTTMMGWDIKANTKL
jgi:type VI protein secretion system component Hcp